MRLLVSALIIAAASSISNWAVGGDNLPPAGFTALFNGKDLGGWKGLVADPPKRATMSSAELATAQNKANERMRAHWKVVDSVLEFDAKGDNLCTEKDYSDFELLLDWKIERNGDSGVYLRSSPQVQIWDPAGTEEKEAVAGSGGLYNNEKTANTPLVKADKAIGEWNSFRIRIIGDKTTVWLNERLVVDGIALENYWERGKPIYPKGAIELQSHGTRLFFKNIYIRELSQEAR